MGRASGGLPRTDSCQSAAMECHQGPGKALTAYLRRWMTCDCRERLIRLAAFLPRKACRGGTDPLIQIGAVEIAARKTHERLRKLFSRRTQQQNGGHDAYAIAAGQPGLRRGLAGKIAQRRVGMDIHLEKSELLLRLGIALHGQEILAAQALAPLAAGFAEKHEQYAPAGYRIGSAHAQVNRFGQMLSSLGEGSRAQCAC